MLARCLDIAWDAVRFLIPQRQHWPTVCCSAESRSACRQLRSTVEELHLYTFLRHGADSSGRGAEVGSSAREC